MVSEYIHLVLLISLMIGKQHIHDVVPAAAGSLTIFGAFIAVVILSFLIFIPDLRNGFLYTWDDSVYIVYNEHINELTGNTVRWAFSTTYADYWAPLTWISLALDRAIWGLNPFGYHLTNNILHAMNAGIFFLTCLMLLTQHLLLQSREGKRSMILTTDRALYAALLASIIFAVHPLRVESVAWASQRKDVLSFFFGIAAALFYLKHAEEAAARLRSSNKSLVFASSWYYWLSVFSYGHSLLSKPMFVTLPVILLILDWFPLKRFKRTALKGPLLEKAPFILFSGIAAVITALVHSSTLVPVQLSPISSRILIAGKAVISYMWLTLWPVNLIPFHVHPGNILGMSLAYIPPLFLVLAITLCCAFLIKRLPVLMASWLIYLVTLLPVLGLVQGGLTEIADRFTYLPSLPLSLLIALCVIALTVRLAASRMAIVIISAVTALLLMIACYLTVIQISHWKDDVTLWSRAIDVKPHFSGRTYFQRGRSYAARGNYHQALEDMNEAMAIATSKNLREMHPIFLERARIRRQLGDLSGAIADYTCALESDSSPSRSMYYYERGNLYQEIGQVDLADEDFKMAEGSK